MFIKLAIGHRKWFLDTNLFLFTKLILKIFLKDEFESKRLDQKLSLSHPDYAETV